MRVFLVQTAKGLFSSSGGYKSSICLLRHLASRGHTVRQLCYLYRGEVDAYAKASAKSCARDLEVFKGIMHLSCKESRSHIAVKVEELVMEDGVQIVGLEKEAFDTAFDGQKNISKTISRETADYIEVFHSE